MALALRVGQRLRGAKGHYELTRSLLPGAHKSTVFQAKVLPVYGDSVPEAWFVTFTSHDNQSLLANHLASVLIKTSAPERRRFLKCEYDCYMRPAISSCASLRAMHDIAGDPADLEIETKNEAPCLPSLRVDGPHPRRPPSQGLLKEPCPVQGYL